VTHITLPRTVLLAAVLGLALFPLIAATFYVQLGAKIMIMAIFAEPRPATRHGLVSLGHAAALGLAAYVLALISPKCEAASVWLTANLPAAMAAAAACGTDHRLSGGAYRWGIFHHGHARLRADALCGVS
jgi:branched-chain amino acid transport system permease protein